MRSLSPLSVRPTGLADGLALKELRYIRTIRTIRPCVVGSPAPGALSTRTRRCDGAIVATIDFPAYAQSYGTCGRNPAVCGFGADHPLERLSSAGAARRLSGVRGSRP